jgi:hypothetical protein
MTQENFNRLLRAFLNRKTFMPFTIELAGGSRIEVNHFEAIELHGDGLVSCQSTTGTRNYFQGTDVIRFINATGTS